MGNPRHGIQGASLKVVEVGAVQPQVDEAADARRVLSYLSDEVIAVMGKDFLTKIPVTVFQEFCIATVERNDPTGQLLHNLLVNFMIAYTNSETNEEAYKAYDYLDILSDDPS